MTGHTFDTGCGLTRDDFASEGTPDDSLCPDGGRREDHPRVYKVGDRVLATYEPNRVDPKPVTREGVVIVPEYGEGLTEVFIGTMDEYDALHEVEGIEVHDRTGVYYDDELEPAPALTP